MVERHGPLPLAAEAGSQSDGCPASEERRSPGAGCHPLAWSYERVEGRLMDTMDAAFETFCKIKSEIGGYLNSVKTEADTRLKVIDRIMSEVLTWPYSEVLAEPPTESGFVDYAFSVSGRSRLILEAKRDGKSLGCEHRQPRDFKLNGPAFKAPHAVEGIHQATRYCGEKNAELACVTNGREWIVFRGTRLGDGLDTMQGVAFVFANLNAVEKEFATFWALMSYRSCQTYGYRPYFSEAEGIPIRATQFRKPLRANGSARYIEGDQLTADLDRIMTTFFHRLTGEDDPDLLPLCFVESKESRYADDQLARISDDVVRRIKELDTADAEQLTTLIERATKARRHEFVVIVGTKGAGKSTFIQRFFRSVLPRQIARECVVMRLDLGDSPGDLENVVQWLDDALLIRAEATLFPDGGPTFEELEGMFFDEYTRLRKGPLARLYAEDKVQFQIRFGDWLEGLRQDRSHEYIKGLMRHIVNNQLRLPVIIFDNADHFDIEFQQRVYQYARSFYEATICLVLLPITDRTSWQLSKHGSLQSFDHEALFLPTPPTVEILRKRIHFLEQRVEVQRERPDGRYFIERGIHLSVDDIAGFTQSLQRIFLQTSNISRWIGELSNHDVRRALQLARDFVTSPHLEVVDLLKAYVAASAMDVPLRRATAAMIRGHYDIYPIGQHHFVQNVYALNEDLETTPFLGIRLLQMLADIPLDEHRAALVNVDHIVGYFNGLNIEARAVHLWLDAMLKTGLCLNYDPTVTEMSDARQVEISPSGRLHLDWGIRNLDYIGAMADVTPVLVEETHAQMVEAIRAKGGWVTKTRLFMNYLVHEDKMYCMVPEHEAYKSQKRLIPNMCAAISKLDSSSASA